MGHQRIKQQLSQYLEGDLAEGARQRVDRHLSACAPCTSELRALRRTRELLRDLPTPEPPPHLANAVIARLRSGEGSPGAAARLAAWWKEFAVVGWPAPIAAVAAGLVAVAVLRGGDVSFVWGPGESPPAPLAAEALVAAPEIEAPLLQASESLAPVRPGAPIGRIRRLTGTDQPSTGAPSLPTLFEACLRSGRSPRTCISGAAFESCLRSSYSPRSCLSGHPWALGLGLSDPDALLRHVQQIPTADREAWLDGLVELAVSEGTAPILARQLRERPHPGARQLADRLERGGAPRR